MKLKKTKSLYTVTYKDLSHTIPANSAQHACRKAFRHWLKNSLIKKQPITTDDGGFEGVVVESHNHPIHIPITLEG